MIRKAALLQVLAGVLAGGGMLLPVVSHAGDETTSVIKVDAGAAASTQLLALPIGRSAVIDLPVDARDVLVSNPQIATAVLRTPRRIYVMGLKSGVTDAMFFDSAGHRLLSLNVRVDQNTSALADTINRILPGAAVKVESINDSVILSGTVTSNADADKAVRIAGATVSNPATQVLNMLSVAGEDQVMLKVRIVEMQRSVIKQLGVDWHTLVNTGTSTQFLLNTAATYGINGALLGGASGSTSYTGSQGSVTGNIQAFEREGLVRTLAEPNLTAVSGEPAKFLVGGEFPVPVAQDVTGQITVQFKDFGVGLGFTPIVLSGGRIQLKLTTEVSELSQLGEFSASSGNSSTTPQLVIPGLNVRRANTTVEMPSGGSLMIAGLLEDTSSQDLDALPGIKDLPVLGALFRSRDYQSGETELVVIVTPYLVNAVNAGQLQTPADGLQQANDKDTIFFGRLNKTFDHADSAPAGRTYQGPYGYVVE